MDITVERPISEIPDFRKGIVVVGYTDAVTGGTL